MLYLGFTNETKEKISDKMFKKYLGVFYKVLKSKIDKVLCNLNGGIDLILVDDSTIKQMNREYRGKNKPTDVISFAYLEVTEYKKTKGDVICGDIFVSVDTAKKQAKKKAHSLDAELAVLFVHGLLHLFGFDHKTDKQEAEMEKWARKVL